MTTQTQINTEMDALRILCHLLIFHDGYIWTQYTFVDFLCWDEPRVKKAIDWLIKKEYVEKITGSYVRTELGREYYEGAKHKPAMRISVAAWKAEALTGLKQMTTSGSHQDWQRSDIDNAVIPKSTAPDFSTFDTTPEGACLAQEEIARAQKRQKRLARALGLSYSKFKRLLEMGLIKKCKGINDQGSHIGRFHKNGKST